MNPTHERLLELRADIARRAEPLDEAELDYLLASIQAQADDDLCAVADLLMLDLDSMRERAAIIETDARLSRVTANRTAVMLALRELVPELSEQAARWIFRNAAPVREYGLENGLSRAELVAEMRSYFERRFGVELILPGDRRAV